MNTYVMVEASDGFGCFHTDLDKNGRVTMIAAGLTEIEAEKHATDRGFVRQWPQ